MVIVEMLSSTSFATDWTCIGYCKISDLFFWLIFIVVFVNETVIFWKSMELKYEQE